MGYFKDYFSTVLEKSLWSKCFVCGEKISWEDMIRKKDKNYHKMCWRKSGR